MAEFIGKRINVEYVQEVGWRRPVKFSVGKEMHNVREVLSRWEQHTFRDPWWQRRHRVHYIVLLDNGKQYEIYWDRGPSGEGKEWVLLKELSD